MKMGLENFLSLKGFQIKIYSKVSDLMKLINF